MLESIIRKRGAPRAFRSDNGPEFISKALFDFALASGTAKVFIDLGKPWQNGRDESFNGKVRDECLSLEYFGSIDEARFVIETWRRQYDELSTISLRTSTHANTSTR